MAGSIVDFEFIMRIVRVRDLLGSVARKDADVCDTKALSHFSFVSER